MPLAARSAYAAPFYTFTALGTADHPTSGYGINNASTVEVVGSIGDSSVLPAYTHPQFTQIGYTSTTQLTAYAVNDSGIAVGGSLLNQPGSAFYSNTTVSTPTRTSIPNTYGGTNGSALAINNNSSVEIVGQADLANGESRAFKYFPTSSTPQMIQLGPSGSSDDTGLGGNDSLFGDKSVNSTATGVNNVMDIVGQATNVHDQSHAFFYSHTSSTMYDLGTANSDRSGTSIANAINDSGLIVGQTDIDGNSRGFIYSGYSIADVDSTDPSDLQLKGQYQLLDSFDGTDSNALAINTSGAVVGYSNYTDADGNQSQHAFIYTGGALYDLNKLGIDLGGLMLDSATGINDAGDITGTASSADGTTYAFLLTPSLPVPEPATAGVLLLGVAIVTGHPRRRI